MYSVYAIIIAYMEVIDNQEKPIESIDEVVKTVVPGLSQAEYEKIRTEAIEKAKSVRHNWKMKGRGVLECTSCEYPHRSYVPTNKRLVGIDDDGLPILK
jgi:hypothetical protein